MSPILRHLKDISKPCAYGVFSAVLLVLAFPPYSCTALIFVGLVPFLLGLWKATGWKDAFLVGFSCMFFFVELGFHWVSDVAVSFGNLPWAVGQAVLAAFALFAELQFLLFALLVFWFFKGSRHARVRAKSALLSAVGLSCSYVALDWLYPKIFPNTFGHALISWPRVVQAAEVTGAYGLTLLIVICNFSVFLLLRGGSAVKKTSAAAGALGLSAIALLFAAFFFWGERRLKDLQALEKSFTRSFRFIAIQANVGDAEKMASENGVSASISRVFEAYRELTLQAVANRGADLVIWPETAFPLLYTHFSNPNADASAAWGRGFVQQLVREIKTPLFFGGYSAKGKKDFNTAFLLNEKGEMEDFYQKSVLLAFGEYLPLGPLSGYVQGLIPSIADFGRGSGPKTMAFRGIRLAPQICYEGLMPGFSREAVKQGADAFLNITNDSWFGDTTEPHTHLALTQFRSIELRRPMIRSTNTGISALIDITGRARWKTPVFKAAILSASTPLPGEGQAFPDTFYLRFGEVFAELACVAAALFLAFAVARQRRS